MSARPDARRARRAARLLAALLAALALAPACRRGEVAFPLRTAEGRKPNVLVITVDTLRPDHLGTYGYPVATSPAIDRLSAAGVRFTDAIATAPETAPAAASLLTGLYQYRTQVLFNRGTLGAHVPTLAEWMRGTGYATGCFAGNFLLDAAHGFAQGCDHFEGFASAQFWEPADGRGVDAAIGWLDRNVAGPWFLWIHLMDPHGPYVSADESWSKDFQYPPYLFGADQPVPLGPSNFGLGVIPKYQQMPGMTRPSQFIRRYDGEIRHTDAQIGRLLAAVEARGEHADTLVVFSADHGESLTEHRELFQHGWFTYDTTIKVPLVLSWPGVLPEGRVVDTQVSGVDLVPTLDELLDLGTPETGYLPLFDGTSFARLLFGPEPAGVRRVAFAVGARENHPFAVRWARWKLIHTPAGRPPVPVQHFPRGGFDTPERLELYNLATDPGEITNLAPNEPKVLELMQNLLATFRQTFRTTGRNW